MKGKKGIIRHPQNKSGRNSDDEKLDQIGMALAEIGINFGRNIFLVFEKSTGKLISEGIFISKKYQNSNDYHINNCDIDQNRKYPDKDTPFLFPKEIFRTQLELS